MKKSIQFSKYQGAGNDFIIIDHRNPFIDHTDVSLIKTLCDRKFGIGADGLILLEQGDEQSDYIMVYFNSDGRTSSMCGNGGRCLAMFAWEKEIATSVSNFMAIDGMHHAEISGLTVKLKMNPVNHIDRMNDAYVLNTGSPHFVDFVGQVKDFDVVSYGRKIRNSEPFANEGINVNFVEKLDDGLMVRTYERGVEDETLSCGTGVTACAIAYHAAHLGQQEDTVVKIYTSGGPLKVYLKYKNGIYQDIWLEGNATHVFDGTLYI